MNVVRLPARLLAAVLVIAAPALAQDDSPARQIALPEPGRSVFATGTIRGYHTIDHVFQAPAGRKLRIDLESASASTYFNLLQDGKDEALFIGSIAGSRYEAVLPAEGNYRIRIYQMRNAARRQAVAHYRLWLR